MKSVTLWSAARKNNVLVLRHVHVPVCYPICLFSKLELGNLLPHASLSFVVITALLPPGLALDYYWTGPSYHHHHTRPSMFRGYQRAGDKRKVCNLSKLG